VCYNDFVLGNGSNYATAYFEVASVKVFGTARGGTVVQGNGTTSSGGTNSTGGNPSGSSDGVVDGVIEKGWWTVVIAGVAAMLFGI
jgi:hypothetical protein